MRARGVGVFVTILSYPTGVPKSLLARARLGSLSDSLFLRPYVHRLPICQSVGPLVRVVLYSHYVLSVSVCCHVCVRVRMRACMRACARAYVCGVYVCLCVCVFVSVCVCVNCRMCVCVAVGEGWWLGGPVARWVRGRVGVVRMCMGVVCA